MATASRHRVKNKPVARSIARRIYWTIFSTSLVSLAAAVAVVLIGYEDLERSILELDLQAERDFVLERTDRQAPVSWKTTNVTAYYVPAQRIGSQAPPEMFRQLPFPFSGEVEIDGKTFLMTLSEVDGGRLYLAKDISLFEQREAMFERLLAAVCLGAVLLGLLLSSVSTRRLICPLRRLATTIRGTPPGPQMPRIELHAEDMELRSISESFNAFIDELEAFVKREQSLLGLASHELRTPIAVVGGALDILDQRDRLSVDDRKTLQRARRAAAEMSANTDALLQLARRGNQAESHQAVDLSVVIKAVLADLGSTAGGTERVRLELGAVPTVAADPALLRMLLSNLLRNALQHTEGDVHVRLNAGSLTVTDHGAGLPEAARHLLRERSLPPGEMAVLSGLGLYIVTLICERLGWALDAQTSTAGTVLRLRFADHQWPMPQTPSAPPP